MSHAWKRFHLVAFTLHNEIDFAAEIVASSEKSLKYSSFRAHTAVCSILVIMPAARTHREFSGSEVCGKDGETLPP